MKLITLLLLFTIQATQAAFIPSPTQAKTVYGVPLLPKGSLMTSDGVNNGSSTVCADDQILVWDALEDSGTKCEAKPVASSQSYAIGSDVDIVGFSISNVYPARYVPAGFSATITTTGGPVELWLIDVSSASNLFPAVWNQGPSVALMSWVRDGVEVWTDDMPTTPFSYKIMALDTPPAGTHTYSLSTAVSGGGSATINYQHQRIYIKEVK